MEHSRDSTVQFTKPVLFTGDFNSYNKIWRRPVHDNRGEKVLSFIDKNELKILNEGGHTTTLGTSKSAIDLTIALLTT